VHPRGRGDHSSLPIKSEPYIIESTRRHELEAEVLAMCDGKTDVEQMFLRCSEMEFDEEGEGKVSEEEQKAIDQVMFQNIVTRLIRLFDHSLVSW
jgi:hypothetical protein